MLKTLLSALIWICCFIVPVQGFGEDALKLKHLLSIAADKNGVGFQQPEGVAWGDKSCVVADTGNGRLLQYAVKEGTLSGEKEIKVPDMTHPIKVQVNSKGTIFVLDGKTRRIIRLSPAGASEGFLDPKGLPPGKGMVPRTFKLDRNDNIYILDILGSRVLLLNSEGEYQKQVDFPRNAAFISDLAVGIGGRIVLIDTVNAMVFASSKDLTSFSSLTKSLKDKMNFPTAIATDKKGLLYILDQNGNRLVILQPDGSFMSSELSMGWEDGALRYPCQLSMNNEDELLIADRSNNRVQLFAVVK